MRCGKALRCAVCPSFASCAPRVEFVRPMTRHQPPAPHRTPSRGNTVLLNRVRYLIVGVARNVPSWPGGGWAMARSPPAAAAAAAADSDAVPDDAQHSFGFGLVRQAGDLMAAPPRAAPSVDAPARRTATAVLPPPATRRLPPAACWTPPDGRAQRRHAPPAGTRGGGEIVRGGIERATGDHAPMGTA